MFLGHFTDRKVLVSPENYLIETKIGNFISSWGYIYNQHSYEKK